MRSTLSILMLSRDRVVRQDEAWEQVLPAVRIYWYVRLIEKGSGDVFGALREQGCTVSSIREADELGSDQIIGGLF